MLREIEIPEFNDPDWQIEQLRVISQHVETLKEMGIDEVAYDELLAIGAHLEALREYSWY